MIEGEARADSDVSAREIAGLIEALDFHAIVAVTDRRGRIIHANRLFCEVSGYALEELLGQDHRILNSGRHPRNYMREMWRTIGRGQVWHGEFCNRAKDGSIYWVKSTIVPVSGEDGRPNAYISIRTDVSELRRVEQQLASSEARFRRLFEQSGDALLLLDADRGAFVDANDAAARMLGFDRGEEVAGHLPAQLSPPFQEDGRESTNAAAEMIEAALEAGTHRFEWTHCSERRAPFPVEVLLTAVALDGQRLLFVTWRDITARRQHRLWTATASQALDGIARRLALADVLAPLFDFACAHCPGLGLALVRRAAPSLQPALVLSRNVAPALLAGLWQGGSAVPPCPLLGDPHCVDACPGEQACSVMRQVDACGKLDVIPLDHASSQRNSLLRVRPDGLDAGPDRLGEVPWQLWLDLVRLALENESSREQLAMSQTVFECSAEGIAVCDEADRVLRANPALARMLGHSAGADDLVGQSFAHWFEDDDGAAHDMARSLARDGSWIGERRLQHASGTPRTWLCSASTVGEERSGQRVLIVTDVTEQRAQRDHIERLAFFDPLTRLPNRCRLQEQLEHVVLRARREAGALALLYLDLDRFKEVNDSCGHAVGDMVLAAIAGRLRTALPPDCFLARMGGDEFMVVTEHSDPSRVAELAEHLRCVLEPPLIMEGRGFSVGASVGISMYPADADSADALMKHADIAMYEAKRSGGGSCFYRSELGSSLNRRLLLAERLRRALKERRLRLHYQPQVDLASGRLGGAEALLRWQEPDIGWVAPGEFIAVAEGSGLMVELGEFVLQEGCRQLSKWRRRGIATGIRLSINISPLQLALADFDMRLWRILDAEGVPESAIELELTESTLVTDPEAALRLFQVLVARGITLAIDDFGTGYSSLSYLKRFPVSRLKIDSAFVRDMMGDGNDATIVETIIAMARALRVQTVAEGVERPEQARQLAALGCTVAQGFLYAPALSAEAFESDWLFRPDSALSTNRPAL